MFDFSAARKRLRLPVNDVDVISISSSDEESKKMRTPSGSRDNPVVLEDDLPGQSRSSPPAVRPSLNRSKILDRKRHSLLAEFRPMSKASTSQANKYVIEIPSDDDIPSTRLGNPVMLSKRSRVMLSDGNNVASGSSVAKVPDIAHAINDMYSDNTVGPSSGKNFDIHRRVYCSSEMASLSLFSPFYHNEDALGLLEYPFLCYKLI